MSGAPLRIGLVGCGEWGRHVLRDLVALGAEVDVCARSDASRARAAAGGAASIVATPEELPGAEGIVVVVPISRHPEVLGRVLPRGVPVFVEKPLAADPVAAERLAEQGAGRLFVMEKWRYHPAVRRMAELSRSGRLGEVSGLLARRVQPGCRHRDVDATWVLLPHDLSIANELLGMLPTPRFAAAERSGGDVAGLVGHCGGGGEPFFSFEASARSPVHRRELRLVGTSATAIWSDAVPTAVELVRSVGSPPESTEREVSTFENTMPLFEELRDFVRFLRGGAPPPATAASALTVVRRIAELRRLAGLSA